MPRKREGQPPFQGGLQRNKHKEQEENLSRKETTKHTTQEEDSPREQKEEEVLERGNLSQSSDDEDECGLEKMYEARSQEDSESDVYGDVEDNEEDFK